jgi:hypothetical protein
MNAGVESYVVESHGTFERFNKDYGPLKCGEIPCWLGTVKYIFLTFLNIIVIQVNN